MTNTRITFAEADAHTRMCPFGRSFDSPITYCVGPDCAAWERVDSGRTSRARLMAKSRITRMFMRLLRRSGIERIDDVDGADDVEASGATGRCAR